MRKRIILIAGFSIVMLLASALTAEARGRFFFGFSFGSGGGCCRPYGYPAYYPGYYGYYPGPFAYQTYSYPGYYAAPVVSYYYAPYRPYRVYRTYRPLYRHEGRVYSDYAPRRYYRR